MASADDGTPDRASSPPGPTIHVGGADPVLAGLAGREPSEEELARRAVETARRQAERADAWRRRFWWRFGILVGSFLLVTLAIAGYAAADWRDGLIMPLTAAALLAAGTWYGWPWLLLAVVLALAPPVGVLLIAGEVGFWFLKVPVLGGLAFLFAFASQWPSASD